MSIPQDTSLPDDVVERAARAAVDDLDAQYQELREGPYTYLTDFMGEVGVDGRVDMLRLVRVISAALKEDANGQSRGHE